MPRRYLHEDNEEAVKYMGLDFRGKDRAAETHLGAISTQMVFKAMSLGLSTQEKRRIEKRSRPTLLGSSHLQALGVLGCWAEILARNRDRVPLPTFQFWDAKPGLSPSRCSYVFTLGVEWHSRFLLPAL